MTLIIANNTMYQSELPVSKLLGKSNLIAKRFITVQAMTGSKVTINVQHIQSIQEQTNQ